MRDSDARRAAIVIALFLVLVASHGRESATALVERPQAALAAYAPAGGDDVCLLVARIWRR